MINHLSGVLLSHPRGAVQNPPTYPNSGKHGKRRQQVIGCEHEARPVRPSINAGAVKPSLSLSNIRDRG
jgi:hypothetical protein